jgi:hypothetical protein
MMAMFTKKIMAALLAIAIASSRIISSGPVGFAFAAKNGKDGITDTMTNSEDGRDNPTSSDPQTPSAEDSSGTTDDTANSVSEKNLKSFSKCVSGAAIDRDLSLSEINDCYGEVFHQGLGQGLDQPSSIR